MVQPRELEVRTEVPLLVVFIDLTRFSAESRKRADAETAEVLDAYYGKVTAAVEAAEGTVVKFIGDAALLAWPEPSVDRGVEALLGMKDELEGWLREMGWGSGLHIKVGFGPVIAGPFGPQRRFDVIGKTVNATAMLSSNGVALSVSAFRKLGSDLRQRFKKHTPPVTYIRQDDPHSRGARQPST
jgi:class 3 adenylate cyclase